MTSVYGDDDRADVETLNKHKFIPDNILVAARGLSQAEQAEVQQAWTEIGSKDSYQQESHMVESEDQAKRLTPVIIKAGEVMQAKRDAEVKKMGGEIKEKEEDHEMKEEDDEDIF